MATQTGGLKQPAAQPALSSTCQLQCAHQRSRILWREITRLSQGKIRKAAASALAALRSCILRVGPDAKIRDKPVKVL